MCNGEARLETVNGVDVLPPCIPRRYRARLITSAPMSAAPKAAFADRLIMGMPVSMPQKQGTSQIVHTATLKRWKLSSACRFLCARTALVGGNGGLDVLRAGRRGAVESTQEHVQPDSCNEVCDGNGVHLPESFYCC